MSSFKWGDTPEGHAFWEEISTVCNDPFKGLGSERCRKSYELYRVCQCACLAGEIKQDTPLGWPYLLHLVCCSLWGDGYPGRSKYRRDEVFLGANAMVKVHITHLSSHEL